MKGVVLACLWAFACDVWCAPPQEEEAESPRGQSLVLIEYSSNPPSAVFESGGQMFLLRAGGFHAPLQLSLTAVDALGVNLTFRLSSGQLLAVHMQRNEELWPDQVRREFEQSLVSPYQSAEPGPGGGNDRP